MGFIRVVFIAGISSLLLLSVFSGTRAFAGMTLDVELRGTYEDNVVGLLSDKGGGKGNGGSPMMALAAPLDAGKSGMGPSKSGAQSTGDFSTTLSASIGNSRDVTESLSLFVIGFVDHTSYSTYGEFDSTIGGITGGMNRELGDKLSARFAVNGKIKRFDDTAMNSTAFSGSLSLKERINPRIWLKEGYEYEKNNADTSSFSYTSNSISVRAGFVPTKKVLLTAGYGYLTRNYDDPAVATLTSHTISAGIERELSARWSVDAAYDRQLSYTSQPGTSSTDNILSAGIRYGY